MAIEVYSPQIYPPTYPFLQVHPHTYTLPTTHPCTRISTDSFIHTHARTHPLIPLPAFHPAAAHPSTPQTEDAHLLCPGIAFPPLLRKKATFFLFFLYSWSFSDTFSPFKSVSDVHTCKMLTILTALKALAESKP